MLIQTSENLSKFFPIAIFFVIAASLSIIILVLTNFLGKKIHNENKLKSYECGFDAISDARGMVDVKFYLVAILFVIFDLEIIFLVPWAIKLKYISDFGFISMVFFLFFLTIGFIYEWKKGALDW